ncbi:SRPBCC family protein [Sediminibacterium soli]|uniref:SRPBCC family protein n=1 Tax=Sediminibacterium soli TaxID=2698829 RepID=UPI00137B0B05|nr:SRPBCC family protein [Sediminibacterium soli]NCI46365.1 polyketide cyclase [Sediminibacterium soli]
MEQKTKVTVTATVHAPVEKVWQSWNNPDEIVQWNAASPDWHSPRAAVDLRTGGTFNIRMEAKDGSMGFDFGGVYDVVDEHRQIDYTMGDGRRVWVNFAAGQDGTTHITETFEAEDQHPVDFQQSGWQSIMDSFRKYVESK